MIIPPHKIKTALTQIDSDDEAQLVTTSLTPASVLIPIYQKEGQTHILFTKRTSNVSQHKGQISFPGGKKDEEDISLEVTALRESYEEVGILQQDITVLGDLPLFPTITNFLVKPYIGVFNYPYEFKVNAAEIDILIEVPLSHLLDEKNYSNGERKFNGRTYTIHYYHYEEHVIWGITGQILNQFLNLLEK